MLCISAYVCLQLGNKCAEKLAGWRPDWPASISAVPPKMAAQLCADGFV